MLLWLVAAELVVGVGLLSVTVELSTLLSVVTSEMLGWTGVPVVVTIPPVNSCFVEVSMPFDKATCGSEGGLP